MSGSDVTTRLVDCGSCRACCHQRAYLVPGQDDFALYDQVDGVIRQRNDGACIYLDDRLGCTIYERRPVICRGFDCGEWFRSIWMGRFDRAARKRSLRHGRKDPQFVRMIAEGEKRA